jgi:hypothetical protein
VVPLSAGKGAAAWILGLLMATRTGSPVNPGGMRSKWLRVEALTLNLDRNPNLGFIGRRNHTVRSS